MDAKSHLFQLTNETEISSVVDYTKNIILCKWMLSINMFIFQLLYICLSVEWKSACFTKKFLFLFFLCSNYEFFPIHLNFFFIQLTVIGDTRCHWWPQIRLYKKMNKLKNIIIHWIMFFVMFDSQRKWRGAFLSILLHSFIDQMQNFH